MKDNLADRGVMEVRRSMDTEIVEQAGRGQIVAFR